MQHFEIDDNTGEIKITQKLDREELLESYKKTDIQVFLQIYKNK